MSKNKHPRLFCVAPMMGYTTPYARTLYRILSKKTFLFTEMIPAKTMINSKKRDLIIENNMQNPIALQVGGSEKEDLIECAKIAKLYNYDEINLNVGCPSKAVQKGSFGACLMNDKNLVRECLESMQNAADINVTLKCRIGIGEKFNYEFFESFINEIAKSKIEFIYVHSRNAILTGLSPKGNRSVPPLNYNFVKKIKKQYPHIKFILNGGIDSIKKAKKLSEDHDGVMVGRLIQNNPFCLSEVDEIFYNFKSKNSFDKKIIFEYFEYIRPKVDKESIYRLLSPILQIFFGIPNSKKFKTEIQKQMQLKEIDKLEELFIKFINENKKMLVS